MFNLCHFLKVEPKANLKATLLEAKDLLWQVSTSGAELEANWGQLIQTLDRGDFDQKALFRFSMKSDFPEMWASSATH